MRAMVLPADAGDGPGRLRPQEVPTPEPRSDEVLVEVERCGVCRTDLHIVDGDLPRRGRPLIPGHEAVGTVMKVGSAVRTLAVGVRVGVPWLRSTCGRCEFCTTGRENLCPEKRFTGYSSDGGYAEQVTVPEGYCFPMPSGDPARLAPLLCAGIIGYRALKLAAPPPKGRIGFFGFGASAHLALQLANRLGFETVAYSRSEAHLDLARQLGASETIRSDASGDPPRAPCLDAGIVFAPAGPVVLAALAELKKGGRLSIPAIHLSPIPAIDYDQLLFGERSIVSVEANTRQDAREFLELARRFQLEATVRERPLEEANAALDDLREGRVVGAAVLDCRSR